MKILYKSIQLNTSKTLKSFSNFSLNRNLFKDNFKYQLFQIHKSYFSDLKNKESNEDNNDNHKKQNDYNLFYQDNTENKSSYYNLIESNTDINSSNNQYINNETNQINSSDNNDINYETNQFDSSNNQDINNETNQFDSSNNQDINNETNQFDSDGNKDINTETNQFDSDGNKDINIETNQFDSSNKQDISNETNEIISSSNQDISNETNQINYDKYLSVIDKIEKEDVEYKYLYNQLNKQNKGLKELIESSLDSMSFFKENLMLICLQIKRFPRTIIARDKLLKDSLKVLFIKYYSLFTNISIEYAFPTFYLFFLYIDKKIFYITSSNYVEIFEEAKCGIFTDKYGMSNTEKLILLGYIGQEIELKKRKEVDIITKSSLNENISFNNMTSFLTCFSYWDIDKILLYKIINLVLNKYEQMSKFHSLNHSLIAANVISKIQKKYPIKKEFNFLIKNLLLKWRDSEIDTNNIKNIISIFSTVNRKDFFQEMVIYVKKINKIDNIYQAAHVINFLSNLDQNELEPFHEFIENLLNCITQNKLYEEPTLEKAFFKNTIILMNKSVFNKYLFDDIFNNYLNYLKPLNYEFLEAFMKIIAQQTDKSLYIKKFVDCFLTQEKSITELIERIIVLKLFSKENNDLIPIYKKNLLTLFDKNYREENSFDLGHFLTDQIKYLTTNEITRIFPRVKSAVIFEYLGDDSRIIDLYYYTMISANMCENDLEKYMKRIITWFLEKNSKYFFHNYLIFLNQNLPSFSQEITINGFAKIINEFFLKEEFLQFEGNFFNLFKILNNYLIYNSNNPFNLKNYDSFRKIVEVIDFYSPYFRKRQIPNIIAINTFNLLSELKISSKFINSLVFDNIYYLFSERISLDYEQSSALLAFAENSFKESKSLLDNIFSDIDYIYESINPFTLEKIFNLCCLCNKTKIVSNEQFYEIIKKICQIAQSSRYKNKFILINLTENIPVETFKEYYNNIISEYKSLFRNLIFNYLLENIMELKLHTLSENSISKKVAIELLYNSYVNDPRPSPIDIPKLISFLKKIDYRSPLFYQEIINKYNHFSNNIKNKFVHYNYLIGIAELGSKNIKVLPIFKKILPFIKELETFKKANLFCSLIMLDHLIIRDLDFFLYLLRKNQNLNHLNLTELYYCLLCLFKLQISEKTNNNFDIEINNIIIQIQTKDMIQEEDLLKKIKRKLNLSVIKYMPFFDKLDDINRSNIQEGLNLRNERIQSALSFKIVKSILKLLDNEIELFPNEEPCNIYIKDQNVSIFVLEEYQKNILDSSIPNFYTNICLQICKKRKKEVRVISEKDLQIMIENKYVDIEDLINKFSSKYNFQMKEISTSNSSGIKEESKNLRNLINSFISNPIE